MWGFLKFVLSAVAVMGVAVFGFAALDKTAVPAGGGMAGGVLAIGIGLVTGLFVAWLRGIAWSQLPQRFRVWSSRFAYDCAWAALGVASVAILLYY